MLLAKACYILYENRKMCSCPQWQEKKQSSEIIYLCAELFRRHSETCCLSINSNQSDHSTLSSDIVCFCDHSL